MQTHKPAPCSTPRQGVELLIGTPLVPTPSGGRGVEDGVKQTSEAAA